jgi:hypothetical protein
MTQPYGKPYTVRGWGDEVVTTVSLDALETVPDGYLPVLRTEGPVILVPTAALTPVDTTPAEPEPGAWLIGDAPCWRDLTQDWRTNDSNIPGDWYEWPRLWALVGGPGVTIRRLIPEPAPVSFPWVEQEHVVDLVAEGVVDGGDLLDADLAEAKGWALLTAARAARKATR